MNTSRAFFTSNLFLFLVIAYTCGAAIPFFLQSAPQHQDILWSSCLALLLLGILPGLNSKIRLATCLVLFFFSGLLSTAVALKDQVQPHHIANLITEKTKTTVMGTIEEMVEFDGEKSRFTLKADEILLHSNDPKKRQVFQKTTGKIRLSIRRESSNTLKPGIKIMTIATLAPIRNYQTTGSFDYRLHMKEKGIFISGWIKTPQHIVTLQSGEKSLGDKISYAAENIRQHITIFLRNNLPEQTGALFQALLTGYRGNISPEVLEQFKVTGCFHLLAISGLHLGLLGGATVFLLTAAAKRSRWLLLNSHIPTLSLCLTFPLLLLYSFIAGMNTPVFRALIMASLAIYAVAARRQKHLLSIIAATAFIILLVSPLTIATPSFQLSFAAVLSVALLFPRIEKWSTDSLPEKKRLTKLTVSVVTISIAASLGTLPVLLFHFNRFSLLSPFMNLFIEPLLCFWALPAGLLAIPWIFIAPDIALFFLHVGQPALLLTQKILTTASHIPHASFSGITPNWLEICCYYSSLFLLFHTSLRKNSTRTPLFCLLVLLAASYSKEIWFFSANKPTKIHFIDIGQGNATFLQLPDRRNILIDGGGARSKHFNVGEGVIGPFLRKIRVWKIDTIILSHPDADHYNGVHYLLKHFNPEHLIINGQYSEQPDYQAILAYAEHNGIAQHVPQHNSITAESDHYELNCLGMNGLLEETNIWTTNDRSLVFQPQAGNFSFLLPGDISTKSERVLLNNSSLTSDVLLASHHGSNTSSSPSFIKSTAPRLIIVSAGYSHQGSHPHSQHTAAWKKQGIPFLSTANTGTITCITDGEQLKIKTFSKEKMVFKSR